MTNKTPKNYKVPFMWSEYNSFSGADFNLLYKRTEHSMKGVNLTGGINDSKVDMKGISIGGLINSSGMDMKGVNIAGLSNVSEEDMKGVNISGLGNGSDGDMKGVSLAGGLNYANKVNDYLISYGTLGNVVNEKGKDSFGLQVGLYNKAGEQYCPIVNVWGVKNIPKLIKKSFNKSKNKSLEDKIE